MSRQVSHSEITTYLDCQKKWELQYLKGLKVDNIHFQFGSMGHEVLEKRIIPDENLYPELKEAFNITSWKNYFEAIFKELDDYLDNNKIPFVFILDKSTEVIEILLGISVKPS